MMVSSFPISFKTIIISIPGKPQPYAAPRKGKFGWYDPKAEEKMNCKYLIRSQYQGPMTTTPVEIGLQFYFPIPKSWPAKKKVAAEAGWILHNNKPDVDNLVKFYLDCLKGIIIRDDAQVVRLSPRPEKIYDKQSRVTIIVRELGMLDWQVNYDGS